jgi:3-methyladenine DNA glycosylase AlkD
MPSTTTAAQFIKRLQALSSPTEAQKSLRYFKSGKGEYGEGDKFIGVRMGDVFNLAKESLEMPLAEIEKLLESPIHEARAGALSIMGQIARRKKTPEARRKELFDLYMRRHDRVNNWDLVDLGALYVVGIHLLDKPRAILYKLARSKNMWERRTAIVSTGQFIRKGEVEDTFKIAEMLLKDDQDLIHKGTGWMLRAAGQVDRRQLLKFLDKHAATMPRTLLRYAIEKFDPKQREHYLGRKRQQAK